MNTLRIPRCLHFLALLIVLALSAAAADKVHVRISSTAQIKGSFENWTKGSSFDAISNYSSPHANRGTVELVLQLQALKAGGLDFDFEFVVVPNNARARLEVVQAAADMTSETVWDNQVDADKPSLLRTEPLLRASDFEKGIYVLPTNEAILKVKSLPELQQFVGAAVNTWEVDVKTLRSLKLKNIELPGTAESVFAMIGKGRADFALVELSSEPDMGIEIGGVRLVPVPGVLIRLLGGTRSCIVAKASPHGEAIFAALTRGLKLLRDEGRITRAYTECGFFATRAANWKRLN